MANARDRRLLTTGGAPIHSVYGADDSARHEHLQAASTLMEQQPSERGSLPNLDELASQPLQMRREEAARLASQRRQETQRQQEEQELLRQNPLRYLAHPQLRVGFRWWKKINKKNFIDFTNRKIKKILLFKHLLPHFQA